MLVLDNLVHARGVKHLWYIFFFLYPISITRSKMCSSIKLQGRVNMLKLILDRSMAMYSVEDKRL